MSTTKSRKIEVWVSRGIIRHDGSTQSILSIGPGDLVSTLEKMNFIRATLEIPEPEKEVTITESQFDQIWDAPMDFESFKDLRRIIRKKLFGERG